MGNSGSLDGCCNPTTDQTVHQGAGSDIQGSQRSLNLQAARETKDGTLWTKGPARSSTELARRSTRTVSHLVEERFPDEPPARQTDHEAEEFGRVPSGNEFSRTPSNEFNRVPPAGGISGRHAMGPQPSTYDVQDEIDRRPSFTRLARGLDRKVTRLLHEFAAVDAHISIKSLLDDMGDDAFPYMNTNSDFGMTPLHTAARRGSLDSARHLIAAGAELEMVTMDGQTVTDLATYGRNRDFIDAIPQLAELQRKRRNATMGVQDSYGSSNFGWGAG